MARRSFRDFAAELESVANEAARNLERQGDRAAAERMRDAGRANRITQAELDAELDGAQDKGLLSRLLGL